MKNSFRISIRINDSPASDFSWKPFWDGPRFGQLNFGWDWLTFHIEWWKKK